MYLTPRNWLVLTPILIALIPLVMMAGFMGKYGYGPGEAWAATMRIPVARTEYAKRFSEDELRKVREEMDDHTVVELIGIPLERRKKDTVWHYSLPRDGAEWYHTRQVFFKRDPLGILRVTGVHSGFQAEVPSE